MSTNPKAEDYIIDYFNQKEGLVASAYHARTQRLEAEKTKLENGLLDQRVLLHQCADFFEVMKQRELATIQLYDAAAYFKIEPENKDITMSIPSISRILTIGAVRDADLSPKDLTIQLYIVHSGSVQDTKILMNADGGMVSERMLYDILAPEFEKILDRFINHHKIH